MKTNSTILALCSLAFAAGAQTTIFNDTFSGGSTLNTANTTPAGNTTGYQVASTKPSTSSISSGDLRMSIASTSSGIYELQALFTTTPVSLATVGDYVTLNVRFTNTTGAIFPAANIASGSSFLSGGLFNSGGVAPVPSGGLASSGIGTGTTFASGYAQNWLGYIGRINGLSANSIVFTRPAQSGANNVSQDLIGAGFSTSGGYANAVALHSLASSGLTVGTGDELLYSIQYMLTAPGTLSITDTLTDNTTSTQLFTDSATASGANLLTTSFDAMSFGYRSATNNTLAVTMDISQISVQSMIQAVPEPSSLGLLGLSLFAAGSVVWSRKKH